MSATFSHLADSTVPFDLSEHFSKIPAGKRKYAHYIFIPCFYRNTRQYRFVDDCAVRQPAHVGNLPTGSLVYYALGNVLVSAVAQRNLYVPKRTLWLSGISVKTRYVRQYVTQYSQVEMRKPPTYTAVYFITGSRIGRMQAFLLVNDSVYVKEYRNDFRKYQGIVHEVLESSVILGFSTKFHEWLILDIEACRPSPRSSKVRGGLILRPHHSVCRFSAVFLPNKQFHIEFGYSKRPLRVEKQAIRLTREHNVVSYFFPKIEPQQIESLSIKTISFFNTILNTEQRRAVRNILETKEVPYLIFGPPGTGKTVTIVEAILQIWKNQPTARILVCAPSNTATNEIALRLVNKIPSTDILRLLGNIYGKDARLRELENIINVNKDDKLPYIPSLEDILKYRVVLTTLVTAARIVNGGVPAGHYTHVFIDESGYATESQTLIAMAGILSNSKHKGNVKGQIVLAGDPRQLGPVVHSNFAKDCGYGNELSNLFTEWEYLKMPNFPLIFHHVQGEDKRESDSPRFRSFRVLSFQIALVIMVEMLRKACKRKQLDNVLIGSVEQFQGKEKLIIIVSTVRSKNLNKFEDIDKKCELGFLRNPKRFNVAITRSKALLIVVGNALVLKNDKNWLTFIQYCVDNGSVAGRAFNLTDNEYLNQEKPADTSSG
ncbi:hypothetical protein NQ317_005417 [Molorchus minor]|uniref:RNA helicase n=1 Tax=Molorchus minor TaxID=1323400 RepID=A0ABQ9JH84_9CUCU|nr:hypothetical protein NQ317_005417 [Molorchus minor]